MATKQKATLRVLLARARYELPDAVKNHMTMLQLAWVECHNAAVTHPLNRRKVSNAEKMNDKYADYIEHVIHTFAPFSNPLDIKRLRLRRTRLLQHLTKLMKFVEEARWKADETPVLGKPAPGEFTNLDAAEAGSKIKAFASMYEAGRMK